ncbi:MAG: hypothetical protein V3S00_01140 [Dehalococcoidia bacterium]
MTTLTMAIERQQWELAALYLLWGVSRAAAVLPPDAVEGLLAVLSPEPDRRQSPLPEKQGDRSGRRR